MIVFLDFYRNGKAFESVPIEVPDDTLLDIVERAATATVKQVGSADEVKVRRAHDG